MRGFIYTKVSHFFFFFFWITTSAWMKQWAPFWVLCAFLVHFFNNIFFFSIFEKVLNNWTELTSNKHRLASSCCNYQLVSAFFKSSKSSLSTKENNKLNETECGKNNVGPYLFLKYSHSHLCWTTFPLSILSHPTFESP